MAVQPGCGQRAPLLLLSGIGVNLDVFEPFIGALDGGIGTLRVDLPGVGGSPATLFPQGLPGLARLLARMLDQLGYAEVDVLGISWGGGLAQQFARQYPDRCRRLVLVSTGTGAIMVPGRLSALLRLLSPHRYRDPAYLEAVAAQLYGGRLRSNRELAAKYARDVRPGGMRGYYWQLLASAGWTSIHWLHQLRQPTLILSGRDDPIVPWVNAQLMACLIPDSALHLFDDGHLGLLTSSAAELAPIVREFLTKEVGSLS